MSFLHIHVGKGHLPGVEGRPGRWTAVSSRRLTSTAGAATVFHFALFGGRIKGFVADQLLFSALTVDTTAALIYVVECTFSKRCSMERLGTNPGIVSYTVKDDVTAELDLTGST